MAKVAEGEDVNLRCLTMFDTADGWVLSPGKIYKIENSSLFSQEIEHLSVFASMCFLSKTYGWVAGDGSVLVKYDGQNWSVPSNSNRLTTLTSVHFPDSLNGYAVGWGGSIHKYKNESWSVDTTMLMYCFHDVHFSSGNFGCAVGGHMIPENHESIIFKKDRNGWKKLNANTTESLNSVFMVDSVNGWAVGGDGRIIKIENEVCTAESTLTNSHLNSIFFLDKRHGWVVGDKGTLLFYNGMNWQLQDTPDSSDYTSVFFIDSVNGWIANSNGQIFRSFSSENLSEQQVNKILSVTFDIQPNPSNPATRLSFSLPVADKVIITLWDISGKKISTLLNNHMSKGMHFVDLSEKLRSGLYICKIMIGGKSMTRNLLVVK